MRRLRRIVLILTLIVAIVLLAAGGFVAYTLQRPLPQLSGTLRLSGLSAPVTVYRDAQGTVHIYASNTRDLFFAQGVVHAQEALVADGVSAACGTRAHWRADRTH